ncbi:MAG: class I SAM-dependent DNA methyltransferase [Bdellovibrionales bacterium]
MIEYFEKRAPFYRAKSARGIWRQFRRREFATVARLLSPRPGQRLIELGCGTGHYALGLRDQFSLNVFAVDSSPAMLRELEQSGVETWLGEAEAVPEDRRFDSALAAGLLEFVEDPAAVFDKCARLLEPRGTFVLLVPVAGLRGALYKFVHEWRGCGVFIRPLREYIKLAERAGFELMEIRNCTPISSALELRRRA